MNYIAALLLLACSALYAQGDLSQYGTKATGFKPYDKGDTVCPEYTLMPGDTLWFRVVGTDTMTFKNDPNTLVKERTEVWRVAVESVDAGGLVRVVTTLEAFFSREKSRDISVEREESEWIGLRNISALYADGRRPGIDTLSPRTAGVAPGGAFQPMFFFPKGDTCKFANESWLLSSVEVTPESSFPPARRKSTWLHRALPSMDTLGRDVCHISINSTGNATAELPAKGATPLKAVNRFTESGSEWLDKEWGIPVAQLVFSAHDITITGAGNKKTALKHRQKTVRSLLRFVRGGRTLYVAME